MTKHLKCPASQLEVGDQFVLSPGAGFGRSARTNVTVAEVDRRPFKTKVTSTKGLVLFFDATDTLTVWSN